MNRLWFENGGLDQIDAELLATLATDGRITIADLARKVGMSPPSVAERIKRLEEAQVSAQAVKLAMSAHRGKADLATARAPV